MARRILTTISIVVLTLGGMGMLVALVWQGIAANGNPDPLAAPPDSTAAILDIGILVFREGLECILVLAAITAGMVGTGSGQRTPVGVGAGLAFICTVITWRVAVGLMQDLTTTISALALQAATGLIAIVVLLIVMNWFFHRIYWTGWISMHTKKRQDLLSNGTRSFGKNRVWWGLAVLGFSSLYREGFEVVLFLQSYRMKLGGHPVYLGVLLGLAFSGIVAILTFVGHHHLPYRKMLVLTGIMLGGVLLVMVGEQVQEMQSAHWLSKTEIPAIACLLPAWTGVWFSVFPTVESLTAQGLAAALVIGSYFAARSERRKQGLVQTPVRVYNRCRV